MIPHGSGDTFGRRLHFAWRAEKHIASHRELTYKIGMTGGDADIRIGTTSVSPIASAIGKTRLASKGRKLAWIDDNGPPIGSRALEIVPHGLNTERL